MNKAIVVEDIHEISIWLNDRLSSVFSDIELINCSSIAEAKETLEHVEHISIALVDLGLPDGCGTEIIELLRKNLPKPILSLRLSLTMMNIYLIA